MKPVETSLTQKQLLEILESACKRGADAVDVTTVQLVEEIAAVLKPFVEGEDNQEGFKPVKLDTESFSK
ncbi:hypothetical protein GN156_05825 [bacterium LRH843]|nr:hypothetical protein [bacterium LRH843]